MNTATLSFSRSSGRPRPFAFDTVLMLTVAALLLFGLVMMTSASTSSWSNFEFSPSLSEVVTSVCP